MGLKLFPQTVGNRAMRPVAATRRDEFLRDARKVPTADGEQPAEAQLLLETVLGFLSHT